MLVETVGRTKLRELYVSHIFSGCIYLEGNLKYDLVHCGYTAGSAAFCITCYIVVDWGAQQSPTKGS